MKAGHVAMTFAAVLLASGAILYAQHEGVPGMVSGTPDMRSEAGRDNLPPGPPEMMGGNPPIMRMGGHAGRQERPPIMPDPEALRKAGASEKQVQALDEFVFQHQVKQVDLRASVEKADLTLERLMRASSPDEKVIAQAVDAVNQARGELLKSDVALRLKMKQVLGDDIMNKLRQMTPSPAERRDRRAPSQSPDDQRPQMFGPPPTRG